ncbi:MAG: glutamine-hydrolyzing carbamoyl-phosphate synthase small subunit [Chlamydiales bacterium]|nr:glutamine-hydrolyzing carbamoyl-phosphate synthase small subunit [Chlamydiales bacterium]
MLILEDRSRFPGTLPFGGKVSAEVVFTTGMCGYTESLTDPSFAGQILVFTYPMIGNYGVDEAQKESAKIHVSGVIVNESCEKWSHHAGMRSLLEWLKEENVPLMTDVDTRALTKKLRTHGTMQGTMSSDALFERPKRQHLVSLVSAVQKRVYGKGKRVIAVDCGMKENILRQLQRFPVEVVRVPYDYDYSDEPFDAVFLSNGPGDPVECTETIAVLRKVMAKQKPIFGICLGSQLLALAAGAKSYKLPFGHRGQNQPCVEVATKRCYITSQNHGYAIDEQTLPDGWEVTFRNLNDGSVEGIAHKTLPFYSVQFHPEAAPGPTDTSWLFERFYHCLNS